MPHPFAASNNDSLRMENPWREPAARAPAGVRAELHLTGFTRRTGFFKEDLGRESRRNGKAPLRFGLQALFLKFTSNLHRASELCGSHAERTASVRMLDTLTDRAPWATASRSFGFQRQSSRCDRNRGRSLTRIDMHFRCLFGALRCSHCLRSVQQSG